MSWLPYCSPYVLPSSQIFPLTFIPSTGLLGFPGELEQIWNMCDMSAISPGKPIVNHTPFCPPRAVAPLRQLAAAAPGHGMHHDRCRQLLARALPGRAAAVLRHRRRAAAGSLAVRRLRRQRQRYADRGLRLIERWRGAKRAFGVPIHP